MIVSSTKYTTLKFALPFLFVFSACTTVGDPNNKKAGLDAIPGDTIVRQSAMEKPLYGKYQRADWVEFRNESKNPIVKAMATLATGEWSAAEVEARNILLSQPSNPTALVILATALNMQKKFQLAAYYAQQLQKQSGYEQNAQVLNLRALAKLSVPKLRMVDIRDAIQLFSEAFQSDSGEIAAGLNLGHLYLETGRADTAAEVFAEVTRRCDNCIAGLLGAGIALGRRRDYAAAKSAFKKILDKEKHHSQALYRLALLTYQDNGDIEEAKSYIDILSTYTPDSEVIIRQRAEALVRAMDAEKDKSKIKTKS